MKKGLLLLLLIIFLEKSPVFAQDNKSHESPYRINYKKDLLITVPCIAGAVLLYPLRNKKDGLDSVTALSMNPGMLSKFNRDATYQYSSKAAKNADLLFESGFIIPFVLIADKGVRKAGFEIPLLYLETMSMAGVVDGLSAGFIDKLRPYVYNTTVPLDKKTGPNANGSFFGSHVLFAATGSFFMAKIFNDYHPGSRLRYAAWTAAGAIILACGYYSYKSGYHFISDIVVGTGIGALAGIIVPQLHKKAADKATSSLFIRKRSSWQVHAWGRYGRGVQFLYAF